MSLKSLNPFVALVSAASLAVAAGCSKTSSTAATATSDTSTVTETAGNSVAGAANSTESTGTVAFNDTSALRDFFKKHLTPESDALASTACPTLKSSTCSSGVITMAYSACKFAGAAATWNGSQVITFTSGTCTSTPEASNATLVRTFGAGTTRTDELGDVITINTSTAAGFASPVSGGVTAVWSGGSRTLTINGIEYTAVNASGTELYDHSVSSTGLSVTGTGASRVVAAGGVITVQHNIAKYIGVVTVAQALTFSASCCYPTGGQLSTVLTGTKTGTETLTYTSTCGSATLVDSTGTTSTITLRQCL